MSLRRRTQLRRRSPLRAMSKKARRRAAAQRQVREQVFARDKVCQLRGDMRAGPCFGPLTPHHLVKRSAGGEDTVENQIALCAGHNGWVEDNPRLARELGLVRRCGEELDQ